MPKPPVFDLTSLAESLEDIVLAGEKPPPPPGKDEKLKFTVHDRVHNAIVEYYMWSNTRMAMLINRHCSMGNHVLGSVNFTIGTRKISPEETPHSIQLKAAGSFIVVRNVEPERPLDLDHLMDEDTGLPI